MKNYKLINNKKIDSMGIEVYLFEHIKTRASITYVKSDDTNKTFAIAFETLPNDSKGMAHIMEHSVLNGSKKYRTKEPFMDMASSSLQTFLNAMTYPDKTVYPVSSENDKDFFNLMDVYLDGVFNPKVLEKEEIFLQEGYHYKLDRDNNLSISGVVYNEMKGALTDPDTIIYNDINKYLFKNSPYQYISGGDFYEIPKISYDEFLDFYKNNYHPSNSRIYFYGDMDIEFYLAYLDREYLSKYDYKKLDKDFEVYDNFYENPIETFYPSSKKDDNLSYLSYSFLAGDVKNLKDSLTLSILSLVLFNLDSSEISNKIYKKIKPESFFARTGYGKRSSLIISAQKTNKDNFSSFVEIIDEGIKKASEKIDKNSLKAAFSILDFSLRDQMNSTSKGLEYFLMSSFYQDPLAVFEIVETLDKLKELIDTSYYEDYVKKYFLNNKTKLLMISNPDQNYTAEKENLQKKYLAKLKESFSEKDFENIRLKEEKLKAYQEKKDSKEEKDTIPKLDIAEIPTKVEKIPRKIINDKYEFVLHEFNTAGLIYAQTYFDINDLSLEDLQYAQVLSDFLGAIDTKDHTYGQLDNLIYTYMGSFSTNVSVLDLDDKPFRNFKLSFKTSSNNLEKSLQIIKEIISKSLFDSKDRMLELLRQRKAVFEMNMYDSAHVLAINRGLAHFNKIFFIKDSLSGISYYLFLKDLIEKIENDFDLFREKILSVNDKIFTQNISINLASDKKDFPHIIEGMKNIYGKLKEIDKKYLEIDFEKKYIKEAILSDANVNYLSMSANLKEFDQEYSSLLSLSSSIISNPYLYELIRAKGGAYGAGLTIDRSLNFASYSYRDPNIEKTIENFGKISEITKNLDLSKRDFTNQKIAKMGSFLKPKSPSEKAELDYINYKKGYDHRQTEKFLQDIKNAKIEDIKAYSPIFKKALDKKNITVFGNREKILENKEYFDRIIDLSL